MVMVWWPSTRGHRPHRPRRGSVKMAGIDTGDTAWMLISTALVMLMTPGLAFFYGGLVRRKNVLSIMMQCFMLIGVISIQWVLFGYSLAFGPDHGGLIGGLELGGPERSGTGTQPRLCRHHPSSALHDLPDDVRRHHPGPHHRRLRRAHEVQRLSSLLLPVGHHRLRSHGPLGLGRGRHDCANWALSTSREG